MTPVLTLIALHAVVVDPPSLPTPVSADPDDDKFLAAAQSAQVPVIVSGDRHLLEVTGWQEILVLSPRQLVDRHTSAVCSGCWLRAPDKIGAAEVTYNTSVQPTPIRLSGLSAAEIKR